MNREIKFRAWLKTEKRMFNVDILEIFTQTVAELGEHFGSGYELCYINLMQYTGLKDKNGKEIYEGDIVVWYDSEYIGKGYKNITGEIVWADLTYQIKDSGGFLNHKRIERNSEYIEVIGNIYENPELMKGSL